MNLQENDDLNGFSPASDFTNQLQTLQSQLPAILADYQKYYVFYNKNPESQEYQQMFQNIKSNLNNVNSQLFTLSNNVQTNIDNINQKLMTINSLIQKEKERNKKLKKNLGMVEPKNDTSTIMIDEYKEIYKSNYLRNWALFLSSLFVLYSISKIYSTNKGNIA